MKRRALAIAHQHVRLAEIGIAQHVGHQAALAAHATARSRVAQFTAQRGIVARVAQNKLVRLKKALQADGVSEADIHKVIPDRTPEREPDEPPATPATAPAPTPEPPKA